MVVAGLWSLSGNELNRAGQRQGRTYWLLTLDQLHDLPETSLGSLVPLQAVGTRYPGDLSVGSRLHRLWASGGLRPSGAGHGEL